MKLNNPDDKTKGNSKSPTTPDKTQVEENTRKYIEGILLVYLNKLNNNPNTSTYIGEEDIEHFKETVDELEALTSEVCEKGFTDGYILGREDLRIEQRERKRKAMK